MPLNTTNRKIKKRHQTAKTLDFYVKSTHQLECLTGDIGFRALSLRSLPRSLATFFSKPVVGVDFLRLTLPRSTLGDTTSHTFKTTTPKL
jgi:hypothetical protein